MNYLTKATIRGKQINFPIYMPDATRGVVKTLDSNDLTAVGVEGCVINTFHLNQEPGVNIIEKAGGMHRMMGWEGLLASDSGGFQIYSLIQQDPKWGQIDKNGFVYYTGGVHNKQRNLFSPEKSIIVQLALDSDIVVCLDYFTPVKAGASEAEFSVTKTTEWAKRSKEEFLRQMEIRKIPEQERPWLLAVIQGGEDKKLRERSAAELTKIGFDAYGFGGHWLNEEGEFDHEIVAFTGSLMPEDKPKFGLGIGSPKAIVEGFKADYQIFDCVLPTRDARHMRLYNFRQNPLEIDILNCENPTEYLPIERERYATDFSPISKYCDCPACKRYSRAYLHHLFKIGDFTAGGLATMHNLRTYTKLIELLRNSVK